MGATGVVPSSFLNCAARTVAFPDARDLKSLAFWLLGTLLSVLRLRGHSLRLCVEGFTTKGDCKIVLWGYLDLIPFMGLSNARHASLRIVRQWVVGD